MSGAWWGNKKPRKEESSIGTRSMTVVAFSLLAIPLVGLMFVGAVMVSHG